ncbi:MAG TPA: DUF5818 domain-containing protein [Candidatus Acidoferrales bacterium]|nr:DUF5818 domain-containing protein [Candidatus Acidoferrales bacterium]
MKKLVIGLVGSLMLLTVVFAAPKDRAYSGEIMDSQCAKNGSHDMMLKKEGMADKIGTPMGAKMCTQNCVKNGGKYVLFNSASKTVYQLDDQTKPADFAGGKVKVTGTLDKATKTIHVTSIEAAS